MMTSQIVLSVYALFLFVGAFMGFKAGSKVSLIMGIVSGCLTLGGVYLIGASTQNGYLFLTILNGLLTGVFAMRVMKTKKMMPSGMLLIMSIAVFAYCLMSLLQYNQTTVSI